MILFLMRLPYSFGVIAIDGTYIFRTFALSKKINGRLFKTKETGFVNKPNYQNYFLPNYTTNNILPTIN